MTNIFYLPRSFLFTPSSIFTYTISPSFALEVLSVRRHRRYKAGFASVDCRLFLNSVALYLSKSHNIATIYDVPTYGEVLHSLRQKSHSKKCGATIELEDMLLPVEWAYLTKLNYDINCNLHSELPVHSNNKKVLVVPHAQYNAPLLQDIAHKTGVVWDKNELDVRDERE